MQLSGHELESEGKLDEALDQYFAALHSDLHFFEVGRGTIPKLIFEEIANWGCQRPNPRGYSSGHRTVASVSAVDAKFENLVKSQYLLQRSWILGDASANARIDGGIQSLSTTGTIDMLMPWERWLRRPGLEPGVGRRLS